MSLFTLILISMMSLTTTSADLHDFADHYAAEHSCQSLSSNSHSHSDIDHEDSHEQHDHIAGSCSHMSHSGSNLSAFLVLFILDSIASSALMNNSFIIISSTDSDGYLLRLIKPPIS